MISVCDEAIASRMKDSNKLLIIKKKISQIEALGLRLSVSKAAQSEYMYVEKKINAPKAVDTNNNFTCDVCSASFKYQHVLVNHMNVMHAGAVQCDKCSGEFPDKYALKLHMKTCMWKCDQCPYNTLRRNEFNKHMMKKHAVK